MKVKQIIRMSAAAFGALAIVSAAPAGAADLYHGGGSLKDQPYVPPPMWTGFYIGGHVGGAWSANNNDDNLGQFTFPSFTNDPTFGTAGQREAAFLRHGDENQSAVFGGVQFGYNWQNFGQGFGLFGANWLLGFEVDFGGFGQSNENRAFTAVDPNPSTGFIATVRERNNNGSGIYGDVTGRLGFTWNNTLIYAKGGFAWITNPFAGLEETVTTPDGSVLFSNTDGFNRDNILTGFTVGGGIEYLFSQNWSVKVEYLFFDFSRENEHCCNDGVTDITTGLPLNDFRFKEDLEFHTVKVGLNYIFNQPPALPLK
jgi:outer membrane immunogenic protein